MTDDDFATEVQNLQGFHRVSFPCCEVRKLPVHLAGPLIEAENALVLARKAIREWNDATRLEARQAWLELELAKPIDEQDAGYIARLRRGTA
jgi:hypothetical protein